MTSEASWTGVMRSVIAAAIGGAAMWLSLAALPTGLLEVEHSGRLNSIFLAMQVAEWPCAGSALGEIGQSMLSVVFVSSGAAWMACMEIIATRIAAKSGKALIGAVFFFVGLLVILPVWPTQHFICPSM